MGRPIKKSKMAGSASGSAGNIAVTAHRAQGGAKVDATKAYIINQRGSKKFKISLADSERNYLLSKFNLLKSIGLLNSDYLKLR